MGTMIAFRIPNADNPPTSHVLHKVADIHTGKIESGRISWRRRRRRTARASGSYVWEAGGTGGAVRAERVEVMARTGGECHGDDVAVLPVDMAVEAFEACVEAEVRWVKRSRVSITCASFCYSTSNLKPVKNSKPRKHMRP